MRVLLILGSLVFGLFLAGPTELRAQQTGRASVPQTLPKFRSGVTYREVRKRLIKLGWQPVTLPTSTPCGDDDRCQGLPEVYFCSGVGQAVCIYMWKKKTTLIRVFGTGESSDQGYYGWKPCKSLNPTEIDGFTCK